MTLTQTIDLMMDHVHALEDACSELRIGTHLGASDADVAACTALPQAKALVGFLPAQAAAVVFMVPVLAHLGRFQLGGPRRGWLDLYIQASDCLWTPQRAVDYMMQQVWFFRYALDGLDTLEPGGVDIDKAFARGR